MENSEQKSFWRLFFFSTPKLSTSLIRCQCAWKTCLHKSTNTHEQTHIYIHCLWHIWRPFLWAPKSTHQFYLSEMKKIDSQKKNCHITRKDCVHKLKHTYEYIYTQFHMIVFVCELTWVFAQLMPFSLSSLVAEAFFSRHFYHQYIHSGTNFHSRTYTLCIYTLHIECFHLDTQIQWKILLICILAAQYIYSQYTIDCRNGRTILVFFVSNSLFKP